MRNLKYLLLLLPYLLQAQQIQVSGYVYDLVSEKPVDNAIIKVLSNNHFETTDVNGKFTLDVLEGTELEISHLAYETKVVKSEKNMRIALNTKSNSLEEILLSGNHLEDITHSITVIDDVKKGSQPRNAAELFNDINGFNIQKRSAMASEPSLRSFKYEQMNIKFDGAVKFCPACPNRMDPITSHIIPEEVGKIEVVKGPYTVRFGQTFGGVVNMVTTNPCTTGLHGSLQSGYELNGENFVTRAEMQYAQPLYDITVNGEYRQFGDYKDGNGVSTPSGFTTTSYSVKAGYKPLKNHQLQVDWRQKFGKDIDHAGLPMDSPKDDSYAVSLDYSIGKLTDKLEAITIKSYYSYVDHLMNNENRPNFSMMNMQTPVISETMGGKFEMKWKTADKWLLYTGLDLENIHRDGDRTRIIKKNMMGVILNPPMVKIDKVWQNATTFDTGIFAEATFKINEKLTTSAGVRGDFVSANIKDPALRTAGAAMGTTVPGFAELYGNGFDKTNETTFAGNLGFKYHQNNNQIQLAYGLGTRSASMLERYVYHMAIGTDSYEYVGNPFLKPEKNHQIELAFSHKNLKYTFGGGVFYSMMKDYISAVYKNGDPNFAIVYSNAKPYAKQFVNVDANQIGFDAFADYQILKSLKFSTSVAFVQADNETFNEPLAKVAPMSVNMGLNYQTELFWTDLRSQYVAQQDRLSASFGETDVTPQHITFDFRIGAKVYKNLNVGASVLNIFDTAYYNHLNFSYNNAYDHVNGEKVYEPGRNFSFYAVYKF